MALIDDQTILRPTEGNREEIREIRNVIESRLKELVSNVSEAKQSVNT